MIPTDWMPHRRSDGETVGYVRMVGEQFQPMDLFGRPLAEPTDWSEAEAVVEEQGLAWLAEPWFLAIERGEVRVRIVEVTPERIVVKGEDFGDMTATTGRWTLPQPEPGRLRPAPPASDRSARG